MASQALYRRWRSQRFEDVVGQEHVATTLRNALRDGHLSHAYLFAGPRGTGKTSTARILAKAINCEVEEPAARPCNHCRICQAITDGSQLDLIEIDAASNRGIDEMRELREKIGFRPADARYKVYIIDEVHMLTKEAFNALLKTLEEPPPHAVFVLATTEPERVPETVRSRCQRFDFRRIPAAAIVQHLAEILSHEGGQAAPEALAAISRRSTGSMRDAISLLDQLLSYGDAVITLERVAGVLGLVDAQVIGRLVDAMVGHDAAAGLELINRIVAEGVDLGQLVDQVVGYLREVLYTQVTGSAEALELSQEAAASVTRQAHALTPAFTLAALREFLEARSALREQLPGAPQLPIELAFLRSVMPGETAGDGKAQEAVAATARAPGQGAPGNSPERLEAATAERRKSLALAARAEQVSPAAAEAGGLASAALPGAPVGLPGTDLVRLAQQNWERFLAMAGKRCGVQVQAGLRAVRALEIAGSALVLQWPPAHKFSRDVVNRSENRHLVEEVWEEVLGQRVEVKCVVVGEMAARAAGPADDEDFLRGARDLGAEVRRLDRAD
jgi:DNA polymerase-3 subunit gamma/tau